MFRKEKSAVEGDPKKSWSGIETQSGDGAEGWLGRNSLRRKKPHIYWIDRKTPVLDPRFNRIRACVTSTAAGTEEEDQMARLSA